MKKIMLVGRVTGWHRSGGMPFVLTDRAIALKEYGFDVHVVSNGQPSKAVDEGITYHGTDSRSDSWGAALSEKADEVYRKIIPDIVHLDSIGSPPFWDRYPRGKVVITMHGFGMGAALTRWNMYRTGADMSQPTINWHSMREESKLLQKVDTVIAVSSWEHRMLVDMYGLKKVRIVHNPIPNYFFEGTPPNANSDIRDSFLCAAVSQGGIRGFSVAIDAAKIANVKLEVVSGVERREMIKFYDKAKAIVLPTAFAQGYDLCIAEGRARNCPAILSRTGSYFDEKTAFDVSVGVHDVQELADVFRNWKNQATEMRIYAYWHRGANYVHRFMSALGPY